MGESAVHGPEAHAAAAPARVTAFQLIAAGVPSFFFGVIGTLVVWAVTREAPPAEGPPSGPSPGLAAAASGAAAPSSSGPVRVGTSAEAQASQALARFRDGIGVCVRDVISVLPGTSPAVPPTLKLMKNGVYTGLASDYKTPVYACAKFSEPAPQPYQIQWQIGASPTEGLGVAWIDDNGDGQADRAFGFTAKLVKKKEVTFGEIVPLSPVPKAAAAR